MELSKKQLLSLPEQLLTNTPLKKIYWLHFQLLTVNDPRIQERVFQELKDIVFNFPLKNKPLLHHDCLIYAANYAAKRFTAGNIQYTYLALSLYEYGLETGILKRNEVLPLEPFLNLVNIYCLKKEFVKARAFIETNKQDLLTTYRQDGYHLGRARIYVGQEKYSKAYKFLSRIQFRHMHFKIQATLLGLICAIEMEDKEKKEKFFEEINQLIINKPNLSDGLINQTKAFLKLAQHLVNGDISKNVLAEKINNSTGLPHKLWLLNKIKKE